VISTTCVTAVGYEFPDTIPGSVLGIAFANSRISSQVWY